MISHQTFVQVVMFSLSSNHFRQTVGRILQHEFAIRIVFAHSPTIYIAFGPFINNKPVCVHWANSTLRNWVPTIC